MPESAYPLGHPAHPAYKGEPWRNPADVGTAAYYPGHPAYEGANVHEVDTPDGYQRFINQRQNDLVDLAACGSLPPLTDPDTNETIALTPAQLAYVHTVRNNIRNAALAGELTRFYKLDPKPADKSAPLAKLSDDDVAQGFIMRLGYSPEQARAILDKYGVPDAVALKLEHERKG
jgi:hypothetical protein